jgi:hypothetical protein
MNFRTNRSVLAALAVVALFGLSAHASPAMAACDIQQWIGKYQAVDASDASRQAALKKLAGPCKGYVAVTSDEFILDVLQDAIRRSYDKAVVQTIFLRYRCIPGVVEDEDYDTLSKALDIVDCPSGYERQNWFVVAVSGALLRSRPTKSGRRVGWVKRGIVVEKVGKSGDWLKVKTWGNKTGFIREDLLAFY